MRVVQAFIIGSLVLTLASCNKEATAPGGDESTPAAKAAAADMTPEELGSLGARLSREPENSEKLLKDEGLDAASFEKAVREVSESPDGAKRYSDAFRKEQGSDAAQPN